MSCLPGQIDRRGKRGGEGVGEMSIRCQDEILKDYTGVI